MSSVPRNVDRLIDAKWVVPVEPHGVVLEDHSVAIAGGDIVGIVPTPEANAAYAPAERISLRQHALIPGLVNAHTHAAMSLLRGYADDKPLMVWLNEHIWPAEAKHVSPQFVYDGTLLACAEMLRAGVTCANDMYFFPESAGQAFVDAGMRAAVGLIALEFPSGYAADADDYIAKGLAARDRLREEPLLSFCMAPHAPYTVSDDTFARLVTIAEELDLPIHLHLHETQDEIAQSLEKYGARPFDRMHGLGLVTPRLIAVHGVHLNAREIETLAQNGGSVVHCPASNLKLASGFAPAASMHEAGVNLALGTDGAASNNRLDILADMRLAALLAKAVSQDAAALPAHLALRMATLNGARALGLHQRIGSIEIGKAADMVAIRLDAPEVSPCYDAVSQIVYSAGREHVSHVWVAGRLLVQDGTLVYFEPGALNKTVAVWNNKLLN
ncbi:MAG TPA: TRZ/ATZ family hydrolase [Burkholderiales bacterium]|nr:TRZ/ATZ family hydrolase [Burkholderiales bacterium]